jgi:hypothetical protein
MQAKWLDPTSIELAARPTALGRSAKPRARARTAGKLLDPYRGIRILSRRVHLKKARVIEVARDPAVPTKPGGTDGTVGTVGTVGAGGRTHDGTANTFGIVRPSI